MKALKEEKMTKKRVDRNAGARRSAPGKTEREGKVFVGFWTMPTTKAALQTRAAIEHKSASALMDEIMTDWLLRGRRK